MKKQFISKLLVAGLLAAAVLFVGSSFSVDTVAFATPTDAPTSQDSTPIGNATIPSTAS